MKPKIHLTNPLAEFQLSYKARTLLAANDWFRTGILLDASACILYAIAFSTAEGYLEILFLSYIIMRTVLYLVFSPGRLSWRKMLFEITLAASVAFIPLLVSNWYEYVISIILFFPTLWVINFILYFIAGKVPPLFSKKAFYILNLAFIILGSGGIYILMTRDHLFPLQLSFDYAAFPVVYYALVLAVCAILRGLVSLWAMRRGSTLK